MHRRRLLQAPLALAAAYSLRGFMPVSAQGAPSLRIAHVFLPTSLDPGSDGNSAFNLIEQGVAETLTRVNGSFQVEPWLAESVTNVDPTTWDIRLRPGATFWDGSPVDAAAVIASFQTAWSSQPDASNFIDPTTQLTVVDDLSIRAVTPTPTGSFPNNLASFHFIIRKAVDGGDPVMTGPYRPSRLVPDQVMELEAYPGHWRGAPSAGRIEIRLVSSANTRVLGLQAGDVDLITQVPAEMIESIGSPFMLEVVPSSRVHSVLFNFNSTLMVDPAIRSAFAMAIDRESLNAIAVEGKGTLTTGPFPALLNVASPLPSAADPDGAAALLDAAGWIAGDGGIRAKAGMPLKMLLASYPSRPEMTAMAVAIQDQLSEVGFEIEVREVEDITAFVESEPWDATMWSFNPLPTGDPLYMFNTALRTGGVFNRGKYSNPQVDEIAARLQVEPDPAVRAQLTEEGVAIAVADGAAAWILSPPRAFAYNPEVVTGLKASPNDLYMIDETLTIAS